MQGQYRIKETMSGPESLRIAGGYGWNRHFALAVLAYGDPTATGREALQREETSGLTARCGLDPPQKTGHVGLRNLPGL